MLFIFLQEPLRLYGEGDYALANVKQMDGTEGFLSLADEVKKCQNQESILECEANAYLDRGRTKCDCVPYHLMSFSTKVVAASLKTVSDRSVKEAGYFDVITQTPNQNKLGNIACIMLG